MSGRSKLKTALKGCIPNSGHREIHKITPPNLAHNLEFKDAWGNNSAWGERSISTENSIINPPINCPLIPLMIEQLLCEWVYFKLLLIKERNKDIRTRNIKNDRYLKTYPNIVSRNEKSSHFNFKLNRLVR